MRIDQLGLLLWKNYVVRKRQPGIMSLVFFWPVVIFMILFAVRDNVDPEYHPTCQFPARSMPQDGLLPFVQSYICTVGNPCDSFSQFEQVPSYRNATLGPLVVDLQPMLGNETVLSAVETLPKSIQLLKSMAQILTRPEIKALFDRGIRLGDLFNNHAEVKGFLRQQIPNAKPGLIDGLFDSSIKLLYLIETFGSSDVSGVVCTPENLKKFLILENEEDFAKISAILCQIDMDKIPEIFENLSKHLDFSGLLGMVDRAMATFREYDFFQDLKKTFETILDLESMKKHIPEYLRMRQWLPQVIMVFKNVTFKEIDVTFINKSIEILNPIFADNRDWETAREGLLRLNKLLGLVKGMLGNKSKNSSEDGFSIAVNHLAKTIQAFSTDSDIYSNITKVLDLTFSLLQDGAKLTTRLIDRHVDSIKLTAEVLDGIRDFFSDNIMNSITYIVSLMENIVEMTHHVTVVHENTLVRFYEVSKKHQDLVRKLLNDVDPKVYRILISSFSKLNFVEEFVDKIRKSSPQEVVCQKETFNEIFNSFEELPGEAEKVRKLLCSESGRKFVADVNEIFEFDKFEQIISNTLSTVISMAFKQPVRVEKSNLTSVVSSVRSFIAYLDSPNLSDPDWAIFEPSESWIKVFSEEQAQGRLDLLAIHLSIAKGLGSRSLSYSTIKPDLQNLDALAKIILEDLEDGNTNWIGDVRLHESELIESFYLTVTDKEKILELLEYANFTKTYCIEPGSSSLLNFPRNSSEAILKSLVCRLSKSVESKLLLNMTLIEMEGHYYNRSHSFNWTGFNRRVIEIYKYIDALIHQEDQHLNSTYLKKLRDDFRRSWAENVSVKEAWEISVGLICKTFSVMESPLFDIQSRKDWRDVYAIAWATFVIFENFEKIIDKIQQNEGVAKIPEVLDDMPQTQIITEAILRNLPSFIMDAVDLLTMKPVHFISVLDEYFQREKHWPCVENESVGRVLELRNGSREIVREMERISCNPAIFIHEWREQPVLMTVRNLFQHNDNVQIQAFNWTFGYGNFRQVVRKFDNLVNNARGVVLAEEPKLVDYMKALSPQIKSIFEERMMGDEEESKTILDYVDLELDKSVKILKSNRTASGIWKPSTTVEERILILAKFIAHAVHKTTKIASDVLRNVATTGDSSSESGKISLLSLLGFDSKTAVAIFYNQLPYILSTLVNGLSDPAVDKRIVDSLKNDTRTTCSQLFEWFDVSRVGLTPREYRILKNFTCDLDPENFNAYTDLYLAETMIWRKPVSAYRSYIMTSLSDLYTFAELVKEVKDQGVIIEQPFSKYYLQHVLDSLKTTLNNPNASSILNEDSSTRWTNYQLFIEGISEALVHISSALKNARIKGNRVTLADLVESGDVRQLLKILELNPEESIALVASLATVNPTDTLAGRSSGSLTRTPLSGSLIKLLEVISNLTVREPHLVLYSSILNSTTWKNLSNETWSLIRKAEGIWIYKHVELLNAQNRELGLVTEENGSDTFPRIVRYYQILNSLTDLLSGGDIWQKLRVTYEASRVKPILTLIEDIPNLVISALDTFVKTERLGDFVEKIFLGKLHPCDIDKYLIPPSFMRKKGLMSSITNFCQKIVFSDTQLNVIDVLPVDARYEESISKSIALGTAISHNETYLLERLEQFQSTLIRVASEGFKELKMPTWWTSFEEGTFKDFLAEYRTRDFRELAHSVVKKISSIMKDVIKSTSDGGDCSWCFTFPIEILNSQLSRHQLYSDLLCRINRLNVSELHDILLEDFYWNKTASMVKNFKYLNNRKSTDEFVATLENTMYYLVDILVNFQNETYSDTMDKCFHQFVGGPSGIRPGLYISFLLGILDTLERNIQILDTATNHMGIGSLTRLAERHVPIWKSVQEVSKKSAADDIEAFLPGATINVNAMFNSLNNSLCRSASQCRNATVLYDYLTSKRAGKVFRYDPKASGYPTIREISERLSQSLDFDHISRQLSRWRLDAGWDLTWLKEILRHLSMVIGEGRNLLDVASRIDFEDISNVLGMPDVVEGVVNILKDKTVDKLFDGIKEILEDVEPFVKDQAVMNDLHRMIQALESMEIFKNLGLLDMKYGVKDMFDNWDIVRSYIVERVGFTNEIASALGQAKIDMVSVFMKERRAISLKDTICSPKKLGDMLNLDNSQLSIEEVSSTLCQLNDSQTQNVTISLIKNLNFDYIFKNLMSANVKNILANANLSETEGKLVLDNLGVAAELLPFFRDRLSSSMPALDEQENEASESDQPMSTTQFLGDANEMLCGKKLVSDNSQLYKIISQIEDNSKEDQRELDSLPTDFCRETYKSVLAMPGGKIVWSYVKPLLRGHILYSPNTIPVTEVMKLANETFAQMENFSSLMESFEQTLTSLANLSDMKDNLKDLQGIMSSDVMKVAIKSLGGGNFEGDFSDLNLSEIAWRLKRSKKLITMVGMLNDLIGCVLMDRIKGFSNEQELEAEARILMETREFLAGVVFLEDESSRSKRSLDHGLPDDVTYKIRMDVDYVPSTRRLKTQFWIPGPESSFIEHLRYLRGFVQLQDSIDRAIVKLKTEKHQNWRTVTQQMPYPCWKYAPFQTTLYESQGVQVCFFFALMMCVGSAVRHIVWERESRNSMVMSVMGLKPWRNTMAWFITSFAELLIVMFSISLILLVGKILPKSDPLLIMLLLVDYIFSIVTFCYMISTMFSSASLAAVTTVVMFLLTYMPYIIVIAMEAVIGLGYKLLICLSMSTSFCYGCLFAVRKEVQGVGLTWSAIWEESSPGDPMSLGLVFVTIAFDGCLYALIGYLISRYTNSGRDFHGLRSRSLWWANPRSIYGRRRYLAFVNNLYFTNDVLHPSATYQDDESDVSSLTVSEKQIGVRFENVRKVYHTDQGDVVAVEDFSLKLCEGEVTSLLGRNGAGKTTIIKMLTGMLAPTSGEICLNGEEGCKPDIGVCPQDNVLIRTLTPREHMHFYSKLKRPQQGIDMQRSVNEMLASLELGRQEHEPVCRLSGGTRRRLCVALAFLGFPKLVILDEPGAGVDPAARRRIWRLIDQHRIGRTVLLSTHHLDEADMLSDTVVIMHKGKILCTGSPLSLKLNHGRGYRLNVAFPMERETNTDSVDKSKLESLRIVVEEVVANATISEISGSEVLVTLPFQGKHGMNNDIAQAAKVLEDNRKLLGFSHFSLECDTLERVFLDLCARADAVGGPSITRASHDSIASVDHVGLSMPSDDIDLIDTKPTLNPSPIRQAKALLRKRIWHFAKDWRSPLAALVLPTMFVAVAMGFSLIRPPSENEPPLDLTPKLYDTHPTYFYSIDDGNDFFLQHVSSQLHDRFGDDYAGAWQTLPNDTGTCQCLDGQQTCHGVSQAVEGLLQVLPGRPTLDWIVSTHQEYIEKRYGGWSLSHANQDPLFVVWFNNKGHHALPSYLNALNDAILRAMGIQGRLRTLNHPLKLSRDQLNRTSLLQHVADVGVALVLLLAFSLVAAQGTKELVRERLSEEKRILYLAGVHPITYWTTALIWDFLVFVCAIGLGVIVFEIFGLPGYVERDNLAGVCLLLFLFAWGAIPFSHLVEKAFDEPSLSNMVLFCVNTFIGVASLATILVLDILGRTKVAEDARNILHNILLIFPQYVLGDALVQLSRNDITAELLQQFNMNTYKSPLGWELLGVHYVFLTVVGGFLFLLNLAIECRLVPSFTTSKCVYEAVEEDDDVARERMRVEGSLTSDVLQTVKLRKEYRSVYGTNVAVQNLSLGIQTGKCFGLLGTNGAGKSTTFKMLTTEVIPTAGKIMLKDEELNSGPLCNGEVGYCPQTDALDGFLTPHQCLTIHGEVCGLSNVSRTVELTLKRLDLLKYAHRRVDSLSGGNKRKLCTAISVMSPVSVVLMDEPTSGMDPATKEFVARAIKNVTKNQGSVILTSHSVAECENLCNRVGILARAGLRCIGTPQHLKHKFGEGYVAFLRFGQPVSAVDLRKAISKYLPQAVLSSRQATTARLLVPRTQELALSTSFAKIKLIAEELKATDYTLTQSSLDQVLVSFSEETEDELIDVSSCGNVNRNNLANAYPNVDTIRMETF